MSSKLIMANKADPNFPLLSTLQRSILINSSVDYSRYARLATLDDENVPCTRMICIRELYKSNHDNRHCLVLTTDKRTSKVNQLYNAIELCWYFPLSQEQYRFKCTAQIIDSTEESKELQQLYNNMWDKQAQATKKGFNNPLTPGTVVTETNNPASIDTSNLSTEMSENYLVVLLFPIEVDYLKLPIPEWKVEKTKPHHRESRLKPQRQPVRWLHKLEANEWKIYHLNP
jgi:hypothetical protein